MRLAKYLAGKVPCSRREAEAYIAGGWVTVDGVVVTLPQFEVDTQRVELSPQARLQPVQPVTLLYHVAAGQEVSVARLSQAIGPDTHWPQDPSALIWQAGHLLQQTVCLPLAEQAGGLQVYTQDKAIIRRLHDRKLPLEQEFVVDVVGTVGEEGLRTLAGFASTQHGELRALKASWQSEQRLRIALKAVGPVSIVALCARVGLEASAVRRLRIGRIGMAKLPAGQWRYLMPFERF